MDFPHLAPHETLIWPGMEHTVRAPFTTISAALFHVLTAYTDQSRKSIPCEERQGAVRYDVVFPSGFSVAIYALQRGVNVTTLSIHFIIHHEKSSTDAQTS